MNTSKYRSPSHNTTALLTVLHTLEEKLAEKQLTHKNIWTLLLENLSKYEIKGEVVIRMNGEKQAIYLTLAAPTGTAKPSLGDEDIFRQVLENGESTYILEQDSNAQSKQGLVEKTSAVIRQTFHGIEASIYSPLTSAGKIRGVLALRAKNLVSGDIPAVEALCHYSTLVWCVLEEDTIPLGLSEEHLGFHQEYVAVDRVYKELFEHSNDAIFIYDFDGAYITVNRQAVNLTGYSELELLSMTLFDLIPGHYHPACRAKFAKLRKGEKTQLHERRFIHKKDFEIPIELSDVAVYGSNGEPLYILSIARDVTERARAEEGLQKTAEDLERRAIQLQVAAEVARDAVKERRLQPLLNKAVDLIKDRFGFYHAGLFLVSEDGRYAVLTAATGEAGQTMIEREHRLRIGMVGIVGHVCETGEARIALDVGEDPVHFENPILPETRSEMAIPLKIGEIVIGVLDVQSRHAAAFDEEDIRVLETMADQLAVAIQNVQLLEDSQQHALQLSSLYETTLITSSVLDTEKILERLYIQVDRLMLPDTFLVGLWDEASQEISIAIAVEDGKEMTDLIGRRVSIEEESLLGWVVEHRKYLLVKNFDEDELPVKPQEHGRKVLSWLGMPFIVRERLIGVVTVQSFEPYTFDNEDRRFLEALATQVAISLENARLFEEAKQRAKELETVRQATLTLTANLQSEEVFNALLNSVLEYLPDAQDAHIFLYDGSSAYFRAVLHRNGNREGPVAAPRPEGLTYQVARSQEVILVPDMQTHPLFADVAPRKGWKGAIMGLPLLIGDRTVGVMNIAYQQPRDFQETELRVLKLLSDQAAIAVENARLFEQVAVEQRRLSLLYDIGKKLTTSLDVGTILEQAIELITHSLGGKVGIATLYNKNTQTLKIHSIYGRDITSSEVQNVRELRLDEGLMGWAAENQAALYIPDVSKDERWAYFEGVDEPQGSLIAAPILSGSSLLGVLSVQSDTEGDFSEEHLDLLEAICQQVGLALSNAYRYQDVNRLVDRLAGEQHRQESLIEGLPIGVLLLAEDYRLEAINTQGKKYLKQLSSAKVGDVIAKLGPYSLSELIARSEEPLPVDIKLPGPSKRVFELQMRPVQNDSQQWIVTLQDVTAMREYQERTQMQARLATVGQLAAGIGHDFNNIMAAILVYTELLLREQNLPPRFEKRLNVIKQQIKQASELIHQMLDFSRSSVMKEARIDLLPFLKELEKLLTRTLPESIRVTLHSEAGEYFVNVDPTRLQQVFMNLAVNARDAMPDGGELSFELACARQGEEEIELYPFLSSGEWVTVTVSDAGTGIPEDVQAHIFEPFFTTKEVGKGTGLGLAQVYGIIKQFEGHIEIESTEGEGTTFTVFLPMLIPAADDDVDQMQDITLNGTGQCVLLVEDDRPAREALKSMLEIFDYRVVTASNGVEALEHLQAQEFYFVMSDIVMPEMGGVDLYNHIQAKWPDLKILFVTGHPLRGKEKKLLEQEKVFWLQKPFTIQEFSQLMEVFLEDVGEALPIPPKSEWLPAQRSVRTPSPSSRG